ncbi:MAG: aldo/keto reductase [Anaerolineae bacterium]|nr:aldo/keto reductase [Anaerolineae bacterium]
MEKRILGRTGLEVSRLGIGLAEIGFELTLEELSRAERVLNTALDNGITFLDTSACYDISEELIGRTIAHRRDEFVLATKAGHVTGGYAGEAWTAQTVRDSIDRSLARMRTDHVDLVQLHSCEVDVLERGEVITALQEAQQAGKTRSIGYSGDNDAALWAVRSGMFDTLQTSFNVVDQNARLRLFDPAKAQRMGIICKRPIANGAWGAETLPSAYAAAYYERAGKMLALGTVPDAPENRILLALGFAFAHGAVDTFIIGTQNPAHLLSNIAMAESQLPISPKVVQDLRRRFEQLAAADPFEWLQRE